MIIKNQPSTTAKKPFYRQPKWLVVIIVSILLFVTFLVIGWLFFSAQQAADRYQAIRTEQSVQLQEQLQKMQKIDTNNTAVVEQAISDLTKKLQTQQKPVLDNVWLGTTLSQKYRSASADTSRTTLQITVLQELSQYINLNKVLSVRLAGAAVRKPITSEADTVASKAIWDTLINELTALELYAQAKESRAHIIEKVKNISDYMAAIGDAYKKQDRAFLGAAHTELTNRIQQLKDQANQLSVSAEILDKELGEAFK